MQQTGNTFSNAPVIKLSTTDIILALPNLHASHTEEKQPNSRLETPATDYPYAFFHYPMQADDDVTQRLTDVLTQHADTIAGTHQPLQVLISTPYILIPDNAFVADQAESLYRYAVTDDNNPLAQPLYLPTLSTYALFTIPESIQKVLRQHAPTTRYMPAVAPLWTYLQQRQTANTPTTLHVYAYDDKLELFAFNGTRFRYANNFSAAHSHDILYYTLYVWEQAGLQPQHDILDIYGNMPQEEWLYDRLRTFLRNVNTHVEKTICQTHGITFNNTIPADIITATLTT